MARQMNGAPPHRPRRGAAMPVLHLTLALAVALLALALPLYLAFSGPDILDCGELRFFPCAAQRMRELGPWGIALSLLTMTLAALTVFPGEAAAMANGAVYGAFWGSALSWAGGMIGANIAFAAARAIGRHAIGLLLTEAHYESIREWSGRTGPLALMTVRLIPLFPFFAVNYSAGLIGMRWWPFNWVSAIGILPAAITFSTMGARMGKMSWLHWTAVTIGIVLAFYLLARCVRWLMEKRAR